MVRPIIRDMNGQVVQDENGPVAMDDPDIFDAFEGIERSFSETIRRAFSSGGFVREDPYVTPRIVQNFIEHARPLLPAGTIIRIHGLRRSVYLEFPNQSTQMYTYEGIEDAIVRCLDHLKSITERHHDPHAQASTTNTDDKASRSLAASVIPAPGARRLILGRAKGPEGGKG